MFEGGGSNGKSGGKSSGSGSSQGSKGATEKGYTAKMVRNIVGIEQKYRRNKDETLHVFTDKGDIVTSIVGQGAEVNFNGRMIPPDSILTHNHPRSLGASGIERIGHSFSKADIRTAVMYNAKEIRAVTPTYTFSLKRPKGGWGVSAQEFVKVYDKTFDATLRSVRDYLDERKWSASSKARVEVTTHHMVMKILAKKYGWDYSKKNK